MLFILQDLFYHYLGFILITSIINHVLINSMLITCLLKFMSFSYLIFAIDIIQLHLLYYHLIFLALYFIYPHLELLIVFLIVIITHFVLFSYL